VAGARHRAGRADRRLTAAARERHVALAFAAALAVTGVVLAASELLGARA
jgi:hypothetical protein